MNPIQELKNKKEKLEKELECKKLDFTICYQHKKLLLHFFEMLQATSSDTKEKFETLETAQKDFFSTLMRCQIMGEKMEAGLINKSALIKKEGLEQKYKDFKEFRRLKKWEDDGIYG